MEISVDADRNLLFGVLALQADLLETAQFVQACTLWTTRNQVPRPLERYALTRLHATGGIGRIWLARDHDLGREVALKELRPERAENTAHWARFLQEARITGQLEHPGVVPVYELARRPGDQ